MSWMQRLFETYEICAKNRAYTEPPRTEDGGKETPPLMPLSHVGQQAHIHVVIDGRGEIQRAMLFPRKTQVVIPATEDSAGRSSDPAPHPLNDKIHYCAKDYLGGKKNLFDLYAAQLEKWCQSAHSHPKAEAVYACISKGVLVKQLIKEGVLCADPVSGALLTKPADEDKASGKDTIFNRLQKKTVNGVGVFDQGDALVAWSVVNLPGGKEQHSWEDASLQRAWMEFDATQMQQKGFCMVQGVESIITTKHPCYIRRPGDRAKLISFNDSSNFTYMGRFTSPEQAAAVGYEVSHKAHNALRWLLARQGYANGEQAVVAWAVNGARAPNPCHEFFETDMDDLLRDDPPAPDADAHKSAQPPEPAANMGLAFGRRLSKALAGYKADLRDTESIIVMALDAASKGRLSVIFYREQMLEEYLGKLEKWQRECSWVLPVKTADEKKGRKKPKAGSAYAIFAPSPDLIADVIYGRRIDDKLRKATVERLLPCIVDAAPLPRDIVESCVRRACNRMTLKPWEWPKVLGVACAMYRGYHARHTQKKEYAMALDETYASRDYLYGRLLAIGEYIERTALELTGEKRPTNAERLMQRFADHPFATWRQLALQLSPYMQRLKVSDRAGMLARAQKVLREATTMFAPEKFSSPEKLSGEFLLGYHCQLTALYTATKKEAATEANDQQGASDESAA